MESSVFGIHSVESRKILFGCALFGESENRFLILDLPDFSVERNAKSEIGFLTLATFRIRVHMHDSLSGNGAFCTVWQIKRLYGAEFSGRQSVIRIATMEIKKEGRSSCQLSKGCRLSFIQFRSSDFFYVTRSSAYHVYKRVSCWKIAVHLLLLTNIIWLAFGYFTVPRAIFQCFQMCLRANSGNSTRKLCGAILQVEIPLDHLTNFGSTNSVDH